MEKKSLPWLWILVGVLSVVAIGVGVWLGFNRGVIHYAREHGIKRAIGDILLSEDDFKETEFLVGVLAWEEQGAVISFTYDEQIGKFPINAKETEVVLMVQPEGSNELEPQNLLSTLSPYWKNAFCMGDTLLMELEESAIGLKKDLGKIESKDVVKITNLGPSKCRKEN